MTFPYDFGFIPRTKGGDGDPVDVLVLMDEPAFPGVVVKCRLIGIIEGEEYDKKDKERATELSQWQTTITALLTSSTSTIWGSCSCASSKNSS
jgi:inorganic pyrophosphatase